MSKTIEALWTDPKIRTGAQALYERWTSGDDVPDWTVLSESEQQFYCSLVEVVIRTICEEP